MENRAHIGVNEFRKINWLPTMERFEQCVSVGVYTFCKNISPSYMSAIFVKNNIQHNTRRSTEMLNIPMKNTNVGQQGLSYLGPKFCNILPPKIKLSTSANSFKHALKEDYFEQLQKADNDPFYILCVIEVNTLYHYNFSYFM